jgi:Flp pilus assembly protein TadG
MRIREETGSSLVEMALCLPILLMVLIGTVQASLAFYTLNFVSYAARSATRYACVHSLQSPQPANTTVIRNYVRDMGYPEAKGTTVSTVWPQGNTPGNVVNVTVQYRFQFTVPLLRLIRPVDIQSTSQMVILN